MHNARHRADRAGTRRYIGPRKQGFHPTRAAKRRGWRGVAGIRTGVLPSMRRVSARAGGLHSGRPTTRRVDTFDSAPRPLKPSHRTCKPHLPRPPRGRAFHRTSNARGQGETALIPRAKERSSMASHNKKRHARRFQGISLGASTSRCETLYREALHREGDGPLWRRTTRAKPLSSAWHLPKGSRCAARAHHSASNYPTIGTLC